MVKKKKAKPAKKATKAKAKKPVRKAKPARKPVAKKVAKKKVTKQKAAAKPKIKIEGTFIGAVTHYFPHVNAAVVKIEKGPLRRGDFLKFKGHTTDFKMQVASIQIDHKPIDQAMRGDEIGLGVTARVREGDQVYKL